MAADFLSIPLKKNGKVAILIGSKQIDTHVSKAVSFVERAQKNGLTVVAVHETDDISENIHHLLEYTLKEHPDLSGIYAATGSILPSHFDNNELYSDGNDYRTDIP